MPDFLHIHKRTILLVVLLCSVLVNVVFVAHNFTKQDQAFAQQLSHQTYPFISKRLSVENQNDILINFVELRRQLQEYALSRPERIGIYFEYLPSGVSIGVNEKENYLLASLLKVPLVMALYDEVNEGKLTLDQEVTIQESDLDANFGSLWQKGVGTKLTLEEAIYLVLTESDNTAKNALMRIIRIEKLRKVFDYHDIPKESDLDGPVVTPKNYSSVLRSLYLSSFLPKDQSNKILDMMTESHHKDLLVADIPKDVKVAHKIGVFSKKDGVSQEIYTDCGIIYESLRPYLLCVMTESDKETAAKNISTISKMVYTYIKSSNK